MRAASAILHQIDPSLEEASVNLGVSPLMTFLRLTLPLMMGGVIGGMVLTWVTVASELSSTVVLYSGPWATMTVVMFQALESTGAGIASAAATVLIVVTRAPGGFGLPAAAALRAGDDVSSVVVPARGGDHVNFLFFKQYPRLRVKLQLYLRLILNNRYLT